MRVSDVSQSGLTHDLGLGFGLGFSMEALMETTNLGLGEGKGLDFAVKRDEKEEGDWRKREDSIFSYYIIFYVTLFQPIGELCLKLLGKIIFNSVCV